jgi:hypothetical protein
MIEELLFVLSIVGIYRILIYAIGDPHDDYNPKSFLSKYTAFIAHIRLYQLRIVERGEHNQSNSIEEEIINNEVWDSYLVNRVKPLAGWANAVGYCSTCTSVWFLLLFVLIPTGSLTMYGISLLISRAAFKYL